MENKNIGSFPANARRAVRLAYSLVFWLSFATVTAAQTLEIEFAQGAFDDERVRRAALLVGDWKQLAGQYGLGVRYVLVRHEKAEEWSERTPADAAMAARLMAEAGFRAGLKTPVFIFHDQPTARLAALMGRAFSKLGIQAEVQFVAPENRAAVVARTRITTGRQIVEIPYVFLTASRRTPPLPDPPPLPDLVVGPPQTSFDPNTRRLTVRVAVENTGPGPVGPNEIAVYDHSGTLGFPRTSAPALRPGNATRVEIQVHVPEGVPGRVLELQAEADPQNAVRELNERNNLSKVAQFRLPEPPARFPDLIVAWEGHRYDLNTRRLTVQALARNIGNALSGPTVADIHDQSGTLQGRLLRREIGPLRPGDNASISGVITLPESADHRTLQLIATVDPDRIVPEVNERNNASRSRIVQIQADTARDVPDERRVADLLVTIPVATAGEDERSIDVTLRVANQGNARADETTLTLQAGPDVPFAGISVPALAPGREWSTRRTVVPKFQAFGGSVNLVAIVDPNDQIPERNKANNRFSRRVTMPPPLLIWGGVGLIFFIVLTMTVPLLRAKPRRGKPPAEKPADKQTRTPPANLAYVPRSDPGYQQIDAENGNPVIALELSVRAIADPGHQRFIPEGT